MNREILFRGFHECDGDTEIIINGKVKCGEWVYGNYTFYEHCPQHSICVNEDIGGDEYNEPKYMLRYYEVISETVGQFTGLTDRTGKKIFEGDVVRFVNEIDNICNEGKGVCVFEQDESNFCLQRTVKNPENYIVPTTTHTIYLISNVTYKDDCWYEVIGTIFDKEIT